MSTLDPYQAPQGDLVDSIDGEGELRTFSSDCRIGRIRYLVNIFLASLAFYSALFLGGFYSPQQSNACGRFNHYFDGNAFMCDMDIYGATSA